MDAALEQTEGGIFRSGGAGNLYLPAFFRYRGADRTLSGHGGASIRQELDAPNYAVHQVKQYIHLHYAEDPA